MTKLELEKWLAEAEKIARQAGAEILKHYTSAKTYTKQDGSEVTDADYAAEQIILPALFKLTPHIPVISEERVAVGEIPDISGGIFWTVDPLDGTREFIKKTDAFVVAISLVVDNSPVMGIIYHPVMDLMYSARGPNTASKVGKDGVRMPLAVHTGKEKPRILVNAGHSHMERIKDYLAKRFDAPDIDGKSGVFRACQVAEGLADMSIVYTLKNEGRVAWWDVAPGHAIVAAAGGRLETLKGQPLSYGDKDLHVPPHVAISPHRPHLLKKD